LRVFFFGVQAVVLSIRLDSVAHIHGAPPWGLIGGFI
jgi:hypothetical protein